MTSDWSVLDIEGVREVVEKAATKVATNYADFVDYDDVYQDALLIVATKHQDVASSLDSDDYTLGTLMHRLTCDLIDKVRTLVDRQTRSTSYDVLVEDDDDEPFRPIEVVVTSSRDDYTREEVESLIPAVWDESYCYGLPLRDDAPDPDMPKGSVNKSHGNLLSALLADIKWAWRVAPLTDKERAAVLLCYGLDWKQKEAAFNQGVSPQAIEQRLFRGIGKIVATLNGTVFTEVLAA